MLALGCEATPSDEPAARPLDTLLEDLASDDIDRRVAASGRLRTTPLDLREQLVAVTAAALPFASDETSAALVRAAARSRDATLVPVVEDLFADYPPEGRVAALALLATLPDRVAAEAWWRLVERHLDDRALPGLATGTLESSPRHGDVFLPDLFDHLAHDRFGWELSVLALRTCRAGLVPAHELRSFAGNVVALYRTHATALAPHQHLAETNFRFEDEAYARHRAWASLLLDLMSCFPSNTVKSTLRSALKLRDPRLRYFAIGSLLRSTGHAPPDVVRAAAASSEVRTWLYELLAEQGRLDLMPEHTRTQHALAESALVQWLLDEEQLGIVPSTVLLEEVVELDTHTDVGVVEYYVFRFRVAPPHWAADRGWMAGVAGAYVRGASPTVTNDGYVFSRYESIDAKPPAAHVGDLDALYQEWHDY